MAIILALMTPDELAAEAHRPERIEAILTSRAGRRTALLDVSDLLPRVPNRELPWRRRYRPRDESAIGYAIVHKSGADGPPGLAGMLASTRFVIDHRGWAGFAYTAWLPRVADSIEVDGEVLPAVYRGNAYHLRTFHTGGTMNTLGVGIGVQGAYDGDADGVIERHPTQVQVDALEGLIAYWAELFPRFAPQARGPRGWRLTTHREHGKPVCPGDALVAIVRELRGEKLAARIVEPPDAAEIDPLRLGLADRQAALALLGYDVGPLPRAIDGVWGYASRAALEAFQAAAGCVVDGAWGPHTAAAMLAALRAAGLAERGAFAAARHRIG